MHNQKPFARKRFGQHFLTDPHHLEKLVNVLQPNTGETVLEIGPGRGALTFPLLKRLGTLTAIEIDRDLSEYLLEKAPNFGTLNLIQADVLKINFRELALPAPIRVIGNLPYNISTPLLFHLLESADLFSEIYAMLQKEVVDRLSAHPGSKEYGRLSVMIQYSCLVEFLWVVPPQAFNPPPKVYSAIVKLSPYTKPPFVAKDLIRFANIVRTAFSHKRKTLQRSLSGLMPKEAYTVLNIDPLRRPETLSVEEFVKLSNYQDDSL